jgi:hypothetical protein
LLLVHSLYSAAFGRLADPDGLTNCIQQLQSGVTLQVLAEELRSLAELQARHGLSQEVDTEFLEALYRGSPWTQTRSGSVCTMVSRRGKGTTPARSWSRSVVRARRPKKWLIGTSAPSTTQLSAAILTRLLANSVRQLQSGMSLEGLAERPVASAEFQTRHGLKRKG